MDQIENTFFLKKKEIFVNVFMLRLNKVNRSMYGSLGSLRAKSHQISHLAQRMRHFLVSVTSLGDLNRMII